MYSYGERVAVDTVDGFEAFVRRAERQARAHEAAFDLPGTAATPAALARHQWYMTDRRVTVELLLRAGG